MRRFERPTFTLATCKPELQTSEKQSLTDALPEAYTEAYIESPDSVQINPDLTIIIERWEHLPESIRSAILVLVKSVEGEGA